MVLPYVYKLTHKETGEFYIGYRCKNKVSSGQDLGFYYFSSSKTVKSMGFENFDIEIMAEFFDWKEAYEFEQNLIKENFKDRMCLNKHYNINGTTKFCSAGIKMTLEQRQKLSKARTGLKLSEESKLKLRNNRNVSGSNNPFYGKKHSEECIDKMAQKMRTFSKEEEMKIILVYSSGLTLTQIHSIYKDRCSSKPIRNIINRYKKNLLKEKGL